MRTKRDPHGPSSPLDMYTKLSASRAYVYAVGRACDGAHISRRVRIFHFSLPLRLNPAFRFRIAQVLFCIRVIVQWKAPTKPCSPSVATGTSTVRHRFILVMLLFCV